ncbi:hypothetical protein ROZALSC1DRAFT_30946 [Rozella allomycis CSF55]|uniref:Uncharacterized protein n=1 Tax=Rozella allomycis (strain CSF55) TaxID=988480 RepID=A0A4P9YDK1_ROZAC|nr:hypothetical protein ROZALSC1DRAFT_30946 [Rozella allomycis CSF55]
MLEPSNVKLAKALLSEGFNYRQSMEISKAFHRLFTSKLENIESNYATRAKIYENLSEIDNLDSMMKKSIQDTKDEWQKHTEKLRDEFSVAQQVRQQRIAQLTVDSRFTLALEKVNLKERYVNQLSAVQDLYTRIDTMASNSTCEVDRVRSGMLLTIPTALGVCAGFMVTILRIADL